MRSSSRGVGGDVLVCSLCAVLTVAAVRAWHQHIHRHSLLFGIWMTAELAFVILQRVRYHQVNVLNPKRPDDDVNVRIRNFLTLSHGVLDIRDFLSGWFMGAPFESLRRENVLDFIAYGFWYQERAAMSAEEQSAVQRTLTQIEAAFDVHIPAGRADGLPFMAHMWQPLRVVHKPLVVHVVSEASVILSHSALWMLGFTAYSVSGFSYWTRGVAPPTDPMGNALRPRSWLAQDARSLISLRPREAAPAAEGPFDVHSALADDPESVVAADYRSRLRDAVANTTAVFQRGVTSLAAATLARGAADLEPFEGVGTVELPLWRGVGEASAKTAETGSPSVWAAWRRRVWAANTATVFQRGVTSLAAATLARGAADLEPFEGVGTVELPLWRGVGEASTKAAETGSSSVWAAWRRRVWAACAAALCGVSLPNASEMRNTLLSGRVTRADMGADRQTADNRSRSASAEVRTPAPAKQSGPKGGAATNDATHARLKTARPAAGQEPILFLHGVGFGMLPYLAFVYKLCRGFPDRPMLLLEVRHVSLRLVGRARGVEDVVQAIACVMRRHSIGGAHCVAHSFGTFVVAHMRQLYPDAVRSVLLADPVCLMTCYPQLLANFVYRVPRAMQVLRNPLAIAKVTIARDMIIAEAFCRYFWWHTLMLWPDDFPRPTLLALSTSDELVPCELVKRQLRAAFPKSEESAAKIKGHSTIQCAPDVHVVLTPGAHGIFLFKPRLQDLLIRRYRKLLEKDDLSRRATEQGSV